MDKKCTKCGIIKDINEFHKDKKSKDRLQSQCKDCKNKSKKQWCLDNYDKYLEYIKWWRLNHRNYMKEWFLDNPEYQNKYDKNRRETDPVFKMIRYYRTRTNLALKDKDKSAKTLELLGCTGPKLMDYFEPMFYANMTRNNYGEVWHVDHIKPCSAFDLTDPEEQKKCFHYSNLQPLLKEDNLKKNNKLDWNNNGKNIKY